MRRAALILAILAIMAWGLGSARAEAASTSPGRAAASPGVLLLGGHCVAVHSSVHHRPGTVCVYVARQSGQDAAELVFTTHSGRLKVVSAQVLRLSLGNLVVQTLRNVSTTATGVLRIVPHSWWDEPPILPYPVPLLRASAYKACMTWTDNDKACIPGWLASQPVPA